MIKFNGKAYDVLDPEGTICATFLSLESAESALRLGTHLPGKLEVSDKAPAPEPFWVTVVDPDTGEEEEELITPSPETDEPDPEPKVHIRFSDLTIWEN